MDSRAAHVDALKMLARRELSSEEVRARLADRGFDRGAIEAAVGRLQESGALDDARVARAYARTAATVKGRGRLRVERELQRMGIRREVAAAAIAEVFGEFDERTLIGSAIARKLRGRPRLADRAEYGRLYQYLMRQGFSAAAVVAALRPLRPSGGAPDERFDTDE